MNINFSNFRNGQTGALAVALCAEKNNQIYAEVVTSVPDTNVTEVPADVNREYSLNNWIDDFDKADIGNPLSEISSAYRLSFTENMAGAIADKEKDGLSALNLSEEDTNRFYGLADGITGDSIRKVIDGKTSLSKQMELDLAEIDKRIISDAKFVRQIAKRLQDVRPILTKVKEIADKNGKPVYVVQKNGKYAVRATEPKGVESVRVEPKKKEGGVDNATIKY